MSCDAGHVWGAAEHTCVRCGITRSDFLLQLYPLPGVPPPTRDPALDRMIRYEERIAALEAEVAALARVRELEGALEDTVEALHNVRVWNTVDDLDTALAKARAALNSRNSAPNATKLEVASDAADRNTPQTSDRSPLDQSEIRRKLRTAAIEEALRIAEQGECRERGCCCDGIAANLRHLWECADDPAAPSEPCACNDPDCELCQSRWTGGDP